MTAHENIAALLHKDRPGHTLPQALYVSEAAHQFDTQVMLKAVWLFACTVAHIKKPGDYYVFELGKNSVIIVRGRDGDVRAFYNSCQHRGARICETERGSNPRFMCPYHQWTYGLDGKLLAARGMVDGFDKAQHGLKPVACENAGGMIFICLADSPPPIDRVKADISAQIARYDLEHCKVAVMDDLIEDANWKLVMENNRECYHCDLNHPELLKSLFAYGYGKGLPEDDGTDVVEDDDFDAMFAAKQAEWKAMGIYHDLIEFPYGWWHRIARLPLANGAVSQTLDGKPACKKMIGGVDKPDTSSLSLWTQPNNWNHFCWDHVVTFSLTPLSANKTLLRTSWLVAEDAVEGVDYDPDNLAAVWRATNRQDGYLSALNHAGIATDGYRPGPYALEEKLVEDFKDFYVRESLKALAAA
ncbi:MAG: aromatic ring-hydroxylating dioxygenase subunit alpha [Alphaproteobacteria bacterium]|nr:aromatic ring-hydroxylating dioxygenase subunit alpha [Alphaproteobacteria bacterium]MDE2041621.1 aromatic ring-hydroxylating dioxygenase subunit alpha [Alphaproteobacteria bacterium]MDE2339461.1 aromatic ring-hydroxylating dioxygenase subunit alpha [Alphaproteobacteria bacterium]